MTISDGITECRMREGICLYSREEEGEGRGGGGGGGGKKKGLGGGAPDLGGVGGSMGGGAGGGGAGEGLGVMQGRREMGACRVVGWQGAVWSWSGGGSESNKLQWLHTTRTARRGVGTLLTKQQST